MSRILSVALIFSIFVVSTLAAWPFDDIQDQLSSFSSTATLQDDGIKRGAIANGSDFAKAQEIVDDFWRLVDDINNDPSNQYSDVTPLAKLINSNIQVDIQSTTITGRSNFINQVIADVDSSSAVRTIVENPIGFYVKNENYCVVLDYYVMQESNDDEDGEVLVGFYTASTIVDVKACTIKYINVQNDYIRPVTWEYFS